MRHLKIIFLVLLLVFFAVGTAMATSFQGYSPFLTSGTLINFEGYPDGTLISNQYPGVTFGQAPLGGSPQINVYPWLYGYGCSSGSAVLTGSTDGGYPYPTVAGLTVAFAAPQAFVQLFLSDTSPLGDYTVTAYDASSTLLASNTVGNTLPPGYSGGVFPPPGTTPLPGIYLGFIYATAEIASIQIAASAYPDDAYAIDDLLYGGAAVPLPSTMLLLGSSLAGLGVMRQKWGLRK